MVGKTDAQRRLARSKAAERESGRWLQEHDGPDPRLRGIASTTGRVGHITALQYDLTSKTYDGEVKNIKLTKQWLAWWKKISDIAYDHQKEPLLIIDPSNDITGLKHKIPTIHLITDRRHAYLLRCERALIELQSEEAE